MREILFRGKHIHLFPQNEHLNGTWVYGYLCDKNYINSPGLNGELTVDPSTVGQYTGLTDKNGKRIFEGDMIKPFDDGIDKMVVEFHHGQFLLCLYGERGYMAEYGWEEEGNYGCFESEPLYSYGDDLEIIGNIHDNQELLEEA